MEPNIWKTGCDFIQQSIPFCLCQIIESHGSVPRRAGSSLIVAADGSTVGTLGGGILEQMAVREAQSVLIEGKSAQRTFNLNDPEGADTGAVCGGSLTVYFDVHVPARVVHLFGAGHVAIPTARLLAGIGYAVRIYDDSAKHASPERFPDAIALVIGNPAQLAAEALIRPEDSVVVLTASHVTDLEVIKALKGRLPAYVGVIGSKAKAAHYRQALLEDGWPQHEIDRIHTPIGLEIGSRTPAEIAVSIAAQMIALRGPSE